MVQAVVRTMQIVVEMVQVVVVVVEILLVVFGMVRVVALNAAEKLLSAAQMALAAPLCIPGPVDEASAVLTSQLQKLTVSNQDYLKARVSFLRTDCLQLPIQDFARPELIYPVTRLGHQVMDS